MFYVKTRKDISNWVVVDSDKDVEILMTLDDIVDSIKNGKTIEGVSDEHPHPFNIYPYKLYNSGNIVKLKLMANIDIMVAENMDLIEIGSESLTASLKIRLSEYCSHVCATAFRMFINNDINDVLTIVLDDKTTFDKDSFKSINCLFTNNRPSVIFDIREVTRKDSLNVIYSNRIVSEHVIK
jgi:hypothetical protein